MNPIPDVSIYAEKLVNRFPALSMIKGPLLAENFPKPGKRVTIMKVVIVPERLMASLLYQNLKHS
ncbi:hypothetical protein Xkoz_01673 [Xenorhabdus kozodoii]|uniref:Uncharacterized protein n=1 Tax=Xenorhabdus kozodoii TaxID=351676 RepID=A0A2D0LCZ6_9GAMM|nr:hypothetical protein Xkoz_01673 [Xenorhabdus kozodoii]